jgi:hypothetical protein
MKKPGNPQEQDKRLSCERQRELDRRHFLKLTGAGSNAPVKATANR